MIQWIYIRPKRIKWRLWCDQVVKQLAILKEHLMLSVLGLPIPAKDEVSGPRNNDELSSLEFLLWAMSEKPVDILNVKMQIRHLYIAVDFFIINNAGRKGDGVGLDASWFISLETVMGIHGSLFLYIYIYLYQIYYLSSIYWFLNISYLNIIYYLTRNKIFIYIK